MNIAPQLNLAYIKIKRLLKHHTIEQIIDYITQNQLIVFDCEDNLNNDQYSALFETIINFCKRIDKKNSCLISSIIYANIMSFLGVETTINIGIVLHEGRKHAHAWIDKIDISPLEIVYIVKTYPIPISTK